LQSGRSGVGDKCEIERLKATKEPEWKQSADNLTNQRQLEQKKKRREPKRKAKARAARHVKIVMSKQHNRALKSNVKESQDAKVRK